MDYPGSAGMRTKKLKNARLINLIILECSKLVKLTDIAINVNYFTQNSYSDIAIVYDKRNER